MKIGNDKESRCIQEGYGIMSSPDFGGRLEDTANLW